MIKYQDDEIMDIADEEDLEKDSFDDIDEEFEDLQDSAEDQ